MERIDPSDKGNKKWYIVDACVSVAFIFCSGMFAGLTIGLASIDRLELELQVKADPSFKLKVKRIFKVID